MLDRQLALSRPAGAALEALVFLVGDELRAVDRELLLGEPLTCADGGEIGEEELEESEVTKLGGCA